jgi:hypothetical protein
MSEKRNVTVPDGSAATGGCFSVFGLPAVSRDCPWTMAREAVTFVTKV